MLRIADDKNITKFNIIKWVILEGQFASGNNLHGFGRMIEWILQGTEAKLRFKVGWMTMNRSHGVGYRIDLSPITPDVYLIPKDLRVRTEVEDETNGTEI